jgi:hypothetical protein
MRSFIYGRILVLNIHSMCAAQLAHLRKTTFVFWFQSYCIHLPICLCSSWFIRLAPLLIFCFFLTPVASVSHICYFCLYFYQHQFHFQTDSTVPFHSMVLVRMQLFFAYIRCSSSQTATCRSAIRYIPYMFRF